MPFQYKDGTPQYLWLYHLQELRDLLDPEDPRYQEVYNILFNEDLEMIEPFFFCQTQPGNPSPITVFDLIDGSWYGKYVQAARQALFVRICEEVP